MMAFRKPQKWKNEESERLTDERDKIKLLILDLKEDEL